MAVKPRPRIVLLECAAPGEAEQGAPDLYLQACLPSDDRALGRFGQKKRSVHLNPSTNGLAMQPYRGVKVGLLNIIPSELPEPRKSRHRSRRPYLLGTTETESAQ